MVKRFSNILLCTTTQSREFPADIFLSEDAANGLSLNGNAQTSSEVSAETRGNRPGRLEYDRLFKTVNSLWFIVSGNENPSVIEMKYNNVDKVISAEALLLEEGDRTWHF